MILPNTIIAGTNKAGTTSLFRYLSDHPMVCGSSVKEICFFSGRDGKVSGVDLQDYAGFFSRCDSAALVRVEASPGYLGGGKAVAEAIDSVLPDVRLIFLLREPVGRLVSFFRRNESRASPLVDGLSFTDFTELAISADRQPRESRDDTTFRIWERLRAGCYAPLLREYRSVFPADRMCVLFFDDLAANPSGVVRRVCDFLGLDPAFYDDYRFSIENKTRNYRMRWLHKLVFQANRRLEPLLNRSPTARKKIRAWYSVLNEKRQQAFSIDFAAENRLVDYYAGFNIELKEFLQKEYPGLELPAWLTRRTDAPAQEPVATPMPLNQ